MKPGAAASQTVVRVDQSATSTVGGSRAGRRRMTLCASAPSSALDAQRDSGTESGVTGVCTHNYSTASAI